MKKAFITIFTLIIMFAAASYDSYANEPNPNLNIQSVYDYFQSSYTNTNDYLYWIETNLYVYALTNYPIGFQSGSIKEVYNPSNTWVLTYNKSTGVFNENYKTSSSRLDNILNVLYSNVDIFIQTTPITVLFPSNYSFVPDQITNPNEYLYITLPREGYKTIDKFMTYNVMYSIAASQVSDVTINPKDITGEPFANNTNIKSFDVVNHTATIENGYLKGTLQLLVDYNSNFIGPIGTQIKVTNTVTNRELSIIRNAEIVAFVDADGDGIDDNTGQSVYDSEESIVVSTPAYGSKSVNRLIPLNFFVRIKGNDYQDIITTTQILYFNSETSLWENLLSSDILNDFQDVINNRNQIRLWNFYKHGDYITLNIRVDLLFEDGFLGEVPIRIITTSDTTGKKLIANHKFSIVPFIDANNDGIDDATGEIFNPNPQLPVYDDTSTSINDAIGSLKNVLPAITTSISTIVSLIGFIFSFLPMEIRVFMLTIMTLIGVTTVLKVLRG